MKHLVACALLASALALPCVASAQIPAPRLVPLNNGLTLLLAPDTSASAVDVAVWYRCGSASERAGQTGISHLFEHMLFRGSAHVAPSEHVRRIQAVGGTANALTTADYTCTWETLPASALPLAFELEADRIGALTLTPANLSAEKRVLAEERRSRSGGLVAIGLEQLYTVAYPNHPYRWPVMGLDGDLEHVTLADCQAWYRTHYGPEQTIVSVVGRFDPDEAVRLAQRWLEPIAPRGPVRHEPFAPAAPAALAARAVRHADVPVPVLAVGWRGPGNAAPDALPLALLSRMAAGRAESPLDYEIMQQKQEALIVQSGFDGRRQGTLFYALVAARPGADTSAVEHDVVRAIERIAESPPPADAVERARLEEETATLFAWQTSRNRADALGAAALVDGDPASALARLERLRTITPQELQQAAKRTLNAAHRCVAWVLPTTPAGPR